VTAADHREVSATEIDSLAHLHDKNARSATSARRSVLKSALLRRRISSLFLFRTSPGQLGLFGWLVIVLLRSSGALTFASRFLRFLFLSRWPISIRHSFLLSGYIVGVTFNFAPVFLS
jgi:hypothetical protein